jgi:3-isopropylmalate dehydrogenase
MTERIAIIPGDGIGIEVTAEATKVLRTLMASRHLPLERVTFDWGAKKYLREGVSLPKGALEMLRRDFQTIFVGAVGDPRVPSNQHAVDILLGIRFGLDLYVNQRPVKLVDTRLCPLRGRNERDINLVIFRENTEGAHVGLGGISNVTPPTKSPCKKTSTRARVWSASSSMRLNMRGGTDSRECA